MANSTELQKLAESAAHKYAVAHTDINHSQFVTPQILLDKWGLEYYELACCLKKTEHTVRKYIFQGENRNSWANVPETILELCAQLDSKWTEQGYAHISIIRYPKK